MTESLVSEQIAGFLSPYLGPFNARIAVKTFAERTVKLSPKDLRPEHVPALLEGLRPMLNTLAGRQATETLLEQIRREVS